MGGVFREAEEERAVARGGVLSWLRWHSRAAQLSMQRAVAQSWQLLGSVSIASFLAGCVAYCCMD